MILYAIGWNYSGSSSCPYYFQSNKLVLCGQENTLTDPILNDNEFGTVTSQLIIDITTTDNRFRNVVGSNYLMDCQNIQ